MQACHIYDASPPPPAGRSWPAIVQQPAAAAVRELQLRGQAKMPPVFPRIGRHKAKRGKGKRGRMNGKGGKTDTHKLENLPMLNPLTGGPPGPHGTRPQRKGGGGRSANLALP